MKQNNKTRYRKAMPGDGRRMLALIESHSAGGALDVLYTRREDAYRSYAVDCEDAEITLCVDEENDIKAQIACLPRRVYIGGEVRTAGYVTGLCKRTNSFVNLPRLFHAARGLSRCDLFFCSMLDGNEGIMKMLGKKRDYMPQPRVISAYTTYLFSPRAVKRCPHDFTFRRATEEDAEKLRCHFRAYGREHDFFPEMTSFRAFHGLDIEDFHVLTRRNGDIVAAGALWNQQDFKQNTIRHYGGIYNVLSRLDFLLRWLRYPPLPKAGAVVDFAYVGFFAAKQDEPHFIRAFLGEIAAIAGQRYATVCIGATENSETNRILSEIKSIHFSSKLCVLDFENDDAWMGMGDRRAFFECGLL
jgi:hypothetical protein